MANSNRASARDPAACPEGPACCQRAVGRSSPLPQERERASAVRRRAERGVMTLTAGEVWMTCRRSRAHAIRGRSARLAADERSQGASSRCPGTRGQDRHEDQRSGRCRDDRRDARPGRDRHDSRNKQPGDWRADAGGADDGGVAGDAQEPLRRAHPSEDRLLRVCASWQPTS